MFLVFHMGSYVMVKDCDVVVGHKGLAIHVKHSQNTAQTMRKK